MFIIVRGYELVPVKLKSNQGLAALNLPSCVPGTPSSYTFIGVSPERVDKAGNIPLRAAEFRFGVVCKPYIPEKFAFSFVVFVI
jgi:hypothetical protein